MSDKISIAEWIKNFDNDEYNSKDFDTQCEAGWYDWFCKDTSLRNKTYKLAPKIKQVAEILGKGFCKTHYLFFKNNCPMTGRLYDDFRFCDMKTHDVIYTIIPKSGHNSEYGTALLWGKENNFKGSIVEGTWKDIIKFFKIKVD
jgi:hypothetical protein